MANPHINYATFKSRFGDLGITEWTKYNYLSNYNFGLPAQIEVPKEYLELEYIQSDGSQYIDTGIDGSNGGTVDTSFIFNDFVSGFICGAHATSSPYKQSFLIHETIQSSGNLLSGECGDTAVSTTCETNKLYHFTLTGIPGEYLKGEANGESLISPIQVGEIVNSNLLLFNARVGESVRVGAKAKLYKWSFYDKYGKLIRNLKPVRRLSDGIIGMYDTVSGTFFQNRGAGTFTAGPMKQRYVRVEYVEFHGDSRVDTGVLTGEGTWTQDADIQFTVVDSQFRYNGADSGYYWGIFGGAQCFAQTRGAPLSPNKLADTLRHHFISKITHGQQHNTLYIDDVPYTSDRQSTDYGSLELCIGGVGNSYTYEKVYSYKIYKDDVLLRSFVPVYDLRDQKYGLYDLVEGKFYGSVNNKLTGPFAGCVYLNGLTWSQSTYIDYAWYATAGVTYDKSKINEFLLVSPLYHYIGGKGGTRYLEGTDKAVAVFDAVDGTYEMYYSNKTGEGYLIGTYLLYK